MSFRDNSDQHRYELEEDGAVAFADYRDERDGRRALTHFETPEALRGRGVAGRLMEQILAGARAGKQSLHARCPYAVTYLERNPAAGDVLSL
jgi:predicted GNAT family acetyltransferase